MNYFIIHKIFSHNLKRYLHRGILRYNLIAAYYKCNIKSENTLYSEMYIHKLIIMINGF